MNALWSVLVWPGCWSWTHSSTSCTDHVDTRFDSSITPTGTAATPWNDENGQSHFCLLPILSAGGENVAVKHRCRNVWTEVEGDICSQEGEEMFSPWPAPLGWMHRFLPGINLFSSEELGNILKKMTTEGRARPRGVSEVPKRARWNQLRYSRGHKKLAYRWFN